MAFSCLRTLTTSRSTESGLVVSRGPASFKTPVLSNRKHNVVSRGPMRVSCKGFDPDSMEVLGVPGVRVVPDNNLSKEVLKGDSTAKDVAFGGLEAVGAKKQEKAKDISLELAYDPELLFNEEGGDYDHIERRLKERNEEKQAEQEKIEKEKYDEMRADLETLRASRVQPQNDPPAMLQYMLETEFNEVEFECVRCREELNSEFFTYLEGEVQKLPNGSDNKEQLTALSQNLKQFVNFTDANIKALASPMERMRDLLVAKDKRAKINEMGEAGEIDQSLLALLMTNINGAKQAKEEQKAEFMLKVYKACSVFVEPDLPAAPEAEDAGRSKMDTNML